MDKNAIKKYAVWARRELISRVSQRAALYEITDKGYGDASADSVLGRVMSAEEKRQRQALIAQIREKGYEQVMEEIAYTWFNRFIALRFMEVNGYLPSRVRVFTDDENNFKPQILTEAINMELDGLDMEKVYALKNANDDDALFKYMIIVQCNALSSILPGMFQRISDYTELLFPDNLLREGSVIEQMVAMIPEADWTDQVQIIGWLYQYYNTEPKDKVFADLKKSIRISKEKIPAATQLFTPDWIVRYMVENSLGRLWLEGHPNDELKASWKYYLDEAEQEPDVQAQLIEIRKKYSAMKPEDILAIDPCQGSGHILAYMFDVLVQIYESYGYTAREAAASIVEHNIWGLDIDDRATQLAYFSVMMKARQYDRRFFNRGIQPHIFAIQESNGIDAHCVEYFVAGRQELRIAITTLVDKLRNAKEFGSALSSIKVDYDLLYSRFEEIKNEVTPSLYSMQSVEQLYPLVQIGQTLSQNYSVVITNPPYMSAAGMSTTLLDYVRKNYPNGKSDLFAVFIERCADMCQPYGYQAMITQHAWMFLSSFSKLREKLRKFDLINMIHLGARAFEEISGEVVQTTSFVFRKSLVRHYQSTFARLVEYGSQQAKESAFLEGKNRYLADASGFISIPNEVYAYWISPSFMRVFLEKQIKDYGNSCIGMRTGDNERFLRYWYEVDYQKLGLGFHCARDAQKSLKKWFPYCKGGSFRKWYGNNDYVVNWENDGYEIKENTKRVYPQLGDDLGWKISNEAFYFRRGLTWSGVGASIFGVRSYPEGMIFDSGANSFFVNNDDYYEYFAGLLNTNIINEIIQIINPTINTGCGVIATLPVVIKEDMKARVTALVKECIEISKSDWDSFETSWDFARHPLVGPYKTVEEAFRNWDRTAEERFELLRQNEEELNSIFIKAYGLESDLTATVESKNVTVRKADLSRDIRGLISYAVGCMFGRYSLDKEGLVYAGGDWNEDQYVRFAADHDNIIPVSDDDYFEDDIVGKFVKFIEVVYGSENLDKNLKFISDALGGGDQPRNVIRRYFMNEFFADHCAMCSVSASGKRPYYWMFESGKKGGFKALIYMHRYQADTIARVRTDYVHEQQSRYRTAIADLENRAANASAGEKVKINKQLAHLRDQDTELRAYEEKIHHLADQMIRINLDDGVKANYAKFATVLAKLK